MCLALLMAAGCGDKAAEKTAESIIESSLEKAGGDANVSIRDEQLKIETKDGSLQFASGDSAQLPPDFPKDVYVDAKAALQTVLSVSGGHNLVLLSKDSLNDISQAFREKMAAEGWQEERSYSGDGQLAIGWNKDGRSVNITAYPVDEGTQIVLNYLPKNEQSVE